MNLVTLFRISACTLYFVLFFYHASAQHTIVDGKVLSIQVVGPKAEPLDFTTIRILTKNDSTEIQSAITDSSGIAIIRNISSGYYLVCVSRVNYISSCESIHISDSFSRQWPHKITISLKNTDGLEAVLVTGRKDPVQYMADRTIIQVDAGINNSGTTALELLERSPGVSIDKDGNISLKGRENVLVMINDKPTYLGPAELSALLAATNSSDIDIIELIDNPSAKYDAAGNSGIINIKLKKNKQKGFNANLSSAYSQGRYPRSNTSLGLNYRNGNLNLFANYSFNANANFISMYALRTYLSDDDHNILALLQQSTFLKGRGNSNNLRTGIDYSVSKKTDIGMVLSGNISGNRNQGTGTGEWLNETGIRDSIIYTSSENFSDWKNGAINVNFRHRANRRNEIAVDLDWVGYQKENLQTFQNERKGTAGYKESFKGDLPSSIRILAFKADHLLKFNDHMKLESGIKISEVKTDNVAGYYLSSGGFWMVDPARTNKFIYAEGIKAAFVSFEKKRDLWTFQLGARYEHTSYAASQTGNILQKDSSFSNRYGNLFPNVLLSYTADSLHEFAFTFGKRVDRPAYQKLNPFVYIINKYTYQSGNPLMRPQFTYNFEISHIYNKFLNTSISYSVSKDYFSQIFFSDSVGTVYYSEGNLGKRQTLGLSVGFTHNMSSSWTVNTQADLLHKKMKGFIWKDMEANITQMNISINNQVRFKKGWTAELSGYFISKNQADIQEVVEPTGQVSIGFSKQLFQSRGNLKLSFRDIFYTQDMEGFTIFNHSTEYFRLQRDSRVFSITFSYRFGKAFKSMPEPKHGSAADEMQRAGT